MTARSTDRPTNRYRRRLGMRLRRRSLHQHGRIRNPNSGIHGQAHHGAGASAEEVNHLSETLEKQKDQLLRLQAEFENFRRRSRRELEENRLTANANLMEKLIPVLDNFSRAMKTQDSSVEGFAEGVQMIHTLLLSSLKDEGLETIEALGKPFDPKIHEAVAIDNSGEQPDNTVVDVLQDGYLVKGKLVRPALVRVARHG